MAVVIVTSIILIFLVALSFFGIAFSQMTFFTAFPRTAAYGDPNKLRYIHLKGFFFIISNDIFGNDVIYQNEASNMMFQYNLKPTMNPAEILNSKKDLNIEILDTVKNETMSYTVPHSAKAQAIRFFTAYRDLMQRIHAHKMNVQTNSENK